MLVRVGKPAPQGVLVPFRECLPCRRPQGTADAPPPADRRGKPRPRRQRQVSYVLLAVEAGFVSPGIFSNRSPDPVLGLRSRSKAIPWRPGSFNGRAVPASRQRTAACFPVLQGIRFHLPIPLKKTVPLSPAAALLTASTA